MRNRLTVAAIVVALLGSCATQNIPSAESSPPEGPPLVQFDLVERHGDQFDDEVPERLPGSQEETAAASYILGHLQLAGYAPYLDGVPVRDQVRSTNVIALPPSGEEPLVLVAIPYDNQPGEGVDGRYLGLFLELARALNAAGLDHRVAFVAMGAESAEHRGTRRLAQYLIDEGWTPAAYSIAPAVPDEEDALTAAGFEHRFMFGSVREIADDLLPVLLGTRS